MFTTTRELERTPGEVAVSGYTGGSQGGETSPGILKINSKENGACRLRSDLKSRVRSKAERLLFPYGYIGA